MGLKVTVGSRKKDLPPCWVFVMSEKERIMELSEAIEKRRTIRRSEFSWLYKNRYGERMEKSQKRSNKSDTFQIFFPKGFDRIWKRMYRKDYHNVI